jgi:ribosomal-protein-alanine N-acetyltransferase
LRTYLFSDEDIRRYVLDLADRLSRLGQGFPATWYTLGVSGDKIAELLQPLIKPASLRARIQIEPIYYNRTTKKVLLRDGSALPKVKSKKPALLLDGAVHSGSSMCAAANAMLASGVIEVVSYAFVVKRTSIFVPSFFGILIDEHDRPYFQLDRIPNNMLTDASPFGVLRRIASSDVCAVGAFLNTGVPSIDRTSIGDLWYADQTEGSIVFVYEQEKKIVAFISFRIADDVMYIELIATDKTCRGQGIGGVLMRWAGSYARSQRCTLMRLRSHKDRVSFYEKHGFEKTGESIDIGDGETYVLMQRKIIYCGNPLKLVS